MKEQNRRVELFRDNIKKFEKVNLKIFCFNKLWQDLDKRENASIIQNSDFLDLLNNLNLNQENFIINIFLILNVLFHRNFC